MTSKVFSNSSNCARGARSALNNPKAQKGTDFDVNTVEGGFTFTLKTDPLPKAAKAPKAPKALPAPKKAKAKKARKPAAEGKRKPSDIRTQPQALKALKLMQRVNGCTVEQGAESLEVEQHTFRGLISRMRSAGVPVNTGTSYRKVTYHVAPSYNPPKAA